MPNLGGVYIAHDAEDEVGEKTADEIMTSFKQASDALRGGTWKESLAFYAKGYHHRGFNAGTIPSTWKGLFEQYREFSVTHVFSKITVEAGSSPPKARVTCTGSLWGMSRLTGRRIHIDNWFDEVHYLVYYEEGRWRIQGHAWEVLMEKETTRLVQYAVELLFNSRHMWRSSSRPSFVLVPSCLTRRGVHHVPRRESSVKTG